MLCIWGVLGAAKLNKQLGAEVTYGWVNLIEWRSNIYVIVLTFHVIITFTFSDAWEFLDLYAFKSVTFAGTKQWPFDNENKTKEKSVYK